MGIYDERDDYPNVYRHGETAFKVKFGAAVSLNI